MSGSVNEDEEDDHRKFKKYYKGKEIEDIDQMIERPFIEVVTLAFYFTNEPNLQN